MGQDKVIGRRVRSGGEGISVEMMMDNIEKLPKDIGSEADILICKKNWFRKEPVAIVDFPVCLITGRKKLEMNCGDCYKSDDELKSFDYVDGFELLPNPN